MTRAATNACAYMLCKHCARWTHHAAGTLVSLLPQLAIRMQRERRFVNQAAYEPLDEEEVEGASMGVGAFSRALRILEEPDLVRVPLHCDAFGTRGILAT